MEYIALEYKFHFRIGYKHVLGMLASTWLELEVKVTSSKNLLEVLDALFRLDCVDNVVKEAGEYKNYGVKLYCA